MWSFLQTLVSGQRGASLTFTKLCPPVLEPHLDEEDRTTDAPQISGVLTLLKLNAVKVKHAFLF